MKEKIVPTIMLTLLITSMLMLAINIQPVKAEGTIYIRADGSVDPPTAPIQRDGDIYTFTDNIFMIIVVERDNIVVNGAGRIVQGTKAYESKGIDLAGRTNVTIKKMEIKSFHYGIYLNGSSYNNISGNNITTIWLYGVGIWLYSSSNNNIYENSIANNEYGIWLSYSSNNSISENSIMSNRQIGIWLYDSSNNNIYKNDVTNSEYYGILVHSSSSNVFRSNSMANNKYNFGVWGDGLLRFVNDVDASNTVNGKPIYYWVNEADRTAPSDAGYVALVNCTRIIVRDLNLSNNGQGISLVYTTNSIITKNSMENNEYGIQLVWSSNNVISENKMINSSLGIKLEWSSDNFIYHNSLVDNTDFQVYTHASTNVWDDGYPSGGNYWSDYVSVDVKEGPNQDLPGSDGLCDTPYNIDASNTDHYPLFVGAPPPPTYSLTITTTAGGTADPAPGTYGYTANSTVQVTAIPAANHLFDYWELDSVNVGSANPYSVLMDKNHALKAVFSLIPPPLSASISPLSASILVGQSVTFTSTVSGGYTPYGYQWYLNGAPVSGATSNTWTFTPTTSGIYYVHLKVTDAKANTAQSDAARITFPPPPPVGGYSFSIQVQTKAEPVLPYIALIATLTAVFTKLRPKTKRKR